mmetsp:Transcript_10489/g.29563  ORF Transcript_10489/g.29563 Transcript_10489/m.29563 type:complete len:419 (+) Transcript_10489:70-1326(+)
MVLGATVGHEPDRTEVAAFKRKLDHMVQNAITVAIAAVADRVGLFELLAKHSNVASSTYLTIAEICEVGKLHPRYITEICGCLACAEFLKYDAEADGFAIEPAQAEVLADSEFERYGAGWFDEVPCLYRAVPGVVKATKCPAVTTGVPFSQQSEWGFSRGMERNNSPGIRTSLARTWLPKSLPSFVERLEAGIKVADLGTGAGAVAFALANAFPASTVVGIDSDRQSIDRANANNPGLTNLSFRCADMADIEPGTFDLITNHDCIHDVADPVGVLRAVRRALKPNGVFFSMEPRTIGESLKENYAVANSCEPVRGSVAAAYGISTLHCMTVSCAEGGCGLGCATFGRRTYERLARKAGFTDFKVVGGNTLDTFYAISGGGGDEGTPSRQGSSVSSGSSPRRTMSRTMSSMSLGLPSVF